MKLSIKGLNAIVGIAMLVVPTAYVIGEWLWHIPFIPETLRGLVAVLGTAAYMVAAGWLTDG